ncbi:hypothetical protein HAX54_046231, partial [Datura stramonium]|nr:hypothetical protein [Datura stramonium]
VSSLDTISESLLYPTHQSSGGLLCSSGYAVIALASQGFGWLVDGGTVSEATSCLKVPTLLSRTSTIEHRLVNLSLAGCNDFLMALCIMDGIALVNRKKMDLMHFSTLCNVEKIRR